MTAFGSDFLNQQGCAVPDCGHDHSILYFHARCHPKAGVEAAYEKASRTLTIKCNQCRKLVVQLVIAPESVSSPASN
jgi:hypothetical protein